MMQNNRWLYVHSGGVAPILNRTLAAFSEHAHARGMTCMAAPYGILGVMRKKWLHPYPLSAAAAATPGSVISSARSRPSDEEITACVEILCAENIQGIVVQGGNDSQDTVSRLHQECLRSGAAVACLGIAKTIDNDLASVYVSPGYPSAAKYLAISFMEAAWDMLAMHHTSAKVLIMETMGRNSGWLAAATSIVSHRYHLPHVLCVPEHVHDLEYLSARIHDCIVQYGYCLITVAEGYPFAALAVHSTDAFGHPQLGGQGQHLADWIQATLHVKVRYVKPDCLKRSCGHVLARYDWDLAEHLAKAAVAACCDGHSGVMLCTTGPKHTDSSLLDVALVANRSRHLHPDYLSPTGCHTTASFVNYLTPLITGEYYPSFSHGLPQYALPFSCLDFETPL